MLGHWRNKLELAESAAKAGRYDEAIALTAQPDVAEHHHTAVLRSKIALDLIARAGRRAEADDVLGAVDDLRVAESLGVGPDTLAAARLTIADKVAVELKADLEAGDPARVAERIDELAKHKLSGPALRRYREIAEAWRLALDESRRGEFGRALDALERAERFAGEIARTHLSETRTDIERRRREAAPRVEALYAALTDGKPNEILAAAEAVLVIVPEHPTARQARSKTWQQIAAISPLGGSLPQRGPRIVAMGMGLEPTPGNEINRGASPDRPGQRAASNSAPAVQGSGRPIARAGEPGPDGRFLLWVDTVGGYLVCLDDRVTLGRAGSDATADIPLLGDLARNHASLSRDGDGYILHAIQPTFVNGRPVSTAATLRDGDVIRLGSSVELEFRLPSPISSTARLDILSRHRLPLAVDGVILMGETFLIGSKPQSHVPAPGMSDSVVIYRQGSALAMRAEGAFEVDGRLVSARSALAMNSSVLGEGFSFSLEPLTAKNSTA
ncbi:MAG: FHA domain-containing protein [Isosphaeraceae bacterium]|nr:FHA domain-containing protein [Isosphaeraceae bacterium]